MKILALDTSTEACSAALWQDGILHQEWQIAPRTHTQLILPMVGKVLASGDTCLQDIDAIAFGCGPGAFTGVRIATGVAQGLALAADKPVIPISTLAALAQQAWHDAQAKQVLVAMDARMAEIYWGEYHYVAGRMQLQGVEQVIKPENAPLPHSSMTFMAVGSGWQVYETQLKSRFSSHLHAINAQWLPVAGFIAHLAVYHYQLGEMLIPEKVEPVYLRNNVAIKTAERPANHK